MKKKQLLIFIVGLLFIAPLSAQNNEVRASAGFITTSDFGDFFSDLIVEAITIGSYSTDNVSNSSAIGFEYWHSQGKVIKLGGLFSYQSITKDVSSLGEKAGNIKNRYFTILPEISFEYVTAEWVQIYSGVGVGVTILNQDFDSSKTDVPGSSASEATFNFHLNVIGMRVGKAFGGSAELGVGAKGILNLGLSYRF